ncbi:MAG: hypothetical protein HFG96_03980 [Lachnospiraceae bacterium]|nr:hypothetical protein [Lachnospiraceae bacterium]RKJ52045.1 hypothetical protein D7Y05_01260 [bacterium 1XD42-54]
MSGRYGADQLSRFMLGVCVVCIVLNLFTHIRGFYLLSLVLIGICYFRMLSRNFAKRSAENEKYLNIVWKIKRKFQQTKNRVVQSKDFHIYKCPSCGQKIRIPRGKGKICITCPKCRQEFEKKS